VEQVRALAPELVITGHGEPIRGAETIRADLDAMHAAVSYLESETIDGMNAGKSVQQLMREIVLPEALTIGQFHGKASWVVRAIWEENAGWFHYEDGTTALYGVPRSAVDADLAELAGGVAALAARAQAYAEAGKPLEALHLLDIALDVAPDDAASLTVKKTALEQLLAASGGTNLSETMWLKAEIADAEKRLSTTG
jgi:alkyl sulfatase BDS1-like metallo-beta-lactamase superfamily hydrolase